MKGLTKRQQEVMEYIQGYIDTHNYSPSYREIQKHFGFSSLGTVYSHIKVLKRKGVIEAEKQASRSMLPVATSSQKNNLDEIELPFIGYISADAPIETFAHSQTLGVPHYLVHNPDRTYILRAKGSSLQEELVADGDLLLVEARQEAVDGETVVALINYQDTVLRQYCLEGDYARLTSRNHDIHPMMFRHEEIAIQGILVGLLRIM